MFRSSSLLNRCAGQLSRSFSSKPTMAQIKELRELSSAPIVDCKNALTEADGDMDAAWEWLRKRGAAAATKLSSREASEGLVGVGVQGTRGSILELNSETDFCSGNEHFQQLVGSLSDLVRVQGAGGGGGGSALDIGTFCDGPATMTSTNDGSEVSVGVAVTEITGKLRENLVLRRASCVSVGAGVIGSYVHGAVAPGMGKSGALVALEVGEGADAADARADELRELGKKIAMHVVAARPQFATRDAVPADVVETERRVHLATIPEGKPPAMIEKIVAGKLGRFYSEQVLLEQKFLLAECGKLTVQGAIDDAARDLGLDISLVDFAFMEVGEQLGGGEGPAE